MEYILESIKQKINNANLGLYAYYTSVQDDLASYTVVTKDTVVSGVTEFYIYDSEIYENYEEFDVLTLTDSADIIGYNIRFNEIDETKTIVDYNYKTGLIKVDSPFNSDIVTGINKLEISISDSLEILPMYIMSESYSQTYKNLMRFKLKLKTNNDSYKVKLMTYESNLITLFADKIVALYEKQDGLYHKTTKYLRVENELVFDPLVDEKNSHLAMSTIMINEFKNIR